LIQLVIMDDLQKYIKNVQPKDKSHRDRTKRLFPYLPQIWSNDYPCLHLPNNQSHQILLDLKSEGNELFSANNLSLSIEFYTHGLKLAKRMNDENEQVENEVISTLLSNRAACYLKIQMWKEGLLDCDNALKLCLANVKAGYRKSIALRGLKRYDDALIAAQNGLLMARKPEEINSFKEIIGELQDIICKSAERPKKEG